MNQLTPSFPHLLAEVRGFWNPLPDKPEETPEAILQALWITAAGTPASVQKAQAMSLPALDPNAADRLRALLDQKKSGTPLGHLTGRQHFLGLELLAGPAAMIPRKETEILGCAALAKLDTLMAGRGEALVLDVCTGSGNLALAYAHHAPGCRVFASDLSEEAVALARRNSEHLGMTGRVEFRTGNLLSPFDTTEFLGKCDLLSCNPPYISTSKVSRMAREISAFEPELAFNGGTYGVSILTQLVQNAPRFLKPASWLCFEVGLGQGEIMAKRLRNNAAFSEVETWQDDAGDVRALTVRTV